MLHVPRGGCKAKEGEKNRQKLNSLIPHLLIKERRKYKNLNDLNLANRKRPQQYERLVNWFHARLCP